ncbi:MAG: FKBP-type peptidyl-prolyl cis-trans isomerase [Clostridia bacterium]|nr:FKBP-type peptidyl-prolyl cis-trans isomerase [Clostridia bacterium]
MKKISVVALLLCLLMALTACGGSASFADVDTDALLTLGDYKGLPYQDVSTAPTEYELQVKLQNAMAESGYGEEDKSVLREGTVQLGDTLNIDYKGMKDGVPFEGGTAQNQPLTIGSGQFIPGFEEGLLGKKVGSTVELPLTFPANYSSAELAGQDVIFEVKINFVSSRITYPELTDDIAKQIDKNVKSAAELLKNQKEALETANIETATSEKRNSLWSKAIENVKFKGDLPKKLLKKAADEYDSYYKQVATQNAHDSIEALLTASGLSMEQYEAARTVYSEGQVKSQLVSYAIAKAENFTITDEIFQEKAKEYAEKSTFTDVDKYIATVTEEVVRDQITLDFAVDFVAENATVTPAK